MTSLQRVLLELLLLVIGLRLVAILIQPLVPLIIVLCFLVLI